MRLKCDECERPINTKTHWYRRRKFCSMLCCQLYIERDKRLFEAKVVYPTVPTESADV